LVKRLFFITTGQELYESLSVAEGVYCFFGGNKMRKKMIAASLSIMLLMSGCVDNETVQPENPQLKILVTRNYGREILAEKTVAIFGGDTVMDIMQDNFNVETAYGGGFVNVIDGLKSGYTGNGSSQNKGTKNDWFYYVNGVMAEMGADQYMCEDANTVSWDYHHWGGDMYVKTRISDWPDSMGERTVEFAYGPGFEKVAGRISGAAQKAGGKTVESNVESLDMEDFEKDALFVGTWEDANENEFIREAFENRARAGLYAVFNDEGLLLFDDNGEAGETSEKGAFAASMQKAYGSEASLFLIVGNDDAMIEKLVDVFLDKGSMKGAFGIAATEEGVCYVP